MPASASDHNATVNETASITIEAAATNKPYTELLLELAQAQIDQNHWALAIILAHTACEVATIRALAKGFSDKDITELEKPVNGFLNGHNLGNNRIRDLYVALTGKKVHEEQFWEDFKIASERRNKIVHGTQPVADITKPMAEQALNAARSLVLFLDS